MNKKRIIIIAAVAGFVILAAVTAFLAKPPAPGSNRSNTEVTYTHKITRELRTAYPYAAEGGEGAPDEPGLIAINGFDDFYNSIDTNKAESIRKQIIAFVRAHGGTGVNETAVVKAQIARTSLVPLIYTFQMTSKRPETTYNVTITFDNSPLVAPTVEITELGL